MIQCFWLEKHESQWWAQVTEEENGEGSTRTMKLSMPVTCFYLQLEPPSAKESAALLSSVTAKWATPIQLFLCTDEIIPVPFNVREGPTPLHWRRATLGGTDFIMWKSSKPERWTDLPSEWQILINPTSGTLQPQVSSAPYGHLDSQSHCNAL